MALEMMQTAHSDEKKDGILNHQNHDITDDPADPANETPGATTPPREGIP